MVMKKIFLAALLSLVLLPATPVMADGPTVSDVADELICQCGCTLVLSNCNHDYCGVGVPMTDTIKEMLAQGQSKEQIIDYFVSRYGEQVLASPPKEGFNIVVWVLPFVAILVGGGVVYLALRRWVRRGERHQDVDVPKTKEGDEEYSKQLEKELDDFSEGGFR